MILKLFIILLALGIHFRLRGCFHILTKTHLFFSLDFNLIPAYFIHILNCYMSRKVNLHDFQVFSDDIVFFYCWHFYR